MCFVQQAIEFVEHLAADVLVGMSESDAWDAFQGRATEPILKLVASLVDCPRHAGRCNPLSLIPGSFAKQVPSAEFMFGQAPSWAGEVWWFVCWRS